MLQSPALVERFRHEGRTGTSGGEHTANALFHFRAAAMSFGGYKR